MNANELKRRTSDFAHMCVKFALSLPKTQLGNHIRGQLIRSATSVAANYRAACNAQSKLSFISKMSIVVEEADESEFWLEFALEEGIVNKVDAENYYMKPIKSLQFSLQQDEHHNKTKSQSKNHKSQITLHTSPIINRISHFTNRQSHFTLHKSQIPNVFSHSWSYNHRRPCTRVIQCASLGRGRNSCICCG